MCPDASGRRGWFDLEEGSNRGMRRLFQQDLERLDQDVMRMGALAEAAVEEAAFALAEGDVDRATRVQASDDAIDGLFVDIESRALELVARQAPVASDLRLIATILRVINDLERVGDLAYNIAGMVRADLEIVTLKDVCSLVYEMGSESKRLLGLAIDAWATKDETLAARMDEYDDTIDELNRTLIRAIFDARNEASFDLAVNLVLVGRYFERIADHAVNISERIAYYVTGDAEHLG